MIAGRGPWSLMEISEAATHTSLLVEMRWGLFLPIKAPPVLRRLVVDRRPVSASVHSACPPGAGVLGRPTMPSMLPRRKTGPAGGMVLLSPHLGSTALHRFELQLLVRAGDCPCLHTSAVSRPGSR